MKYLLSGIVLVCFLVFFTEACGADEQIRDIFLVKMLPGEISEQIDYQMVDKLKEKSTSNFRAGDSIFVFTVFCPKKEKIVDFEFYHFGCLKPKLNTTHFLKEYREGDMYFVQARLITNSSIGDRFLGSKLDGPWSVKIFFDGAAEEAASIEFYIQ